MDMDAVSLSRARHATGANAADRLTIEKNAVFVELAGFFAILKDFLKFKTFCDSLQNVGPDGGIGRRTSFRY
jgi:hypothetical protein